MLWLNKTVRPKEVKTRLIRSTRPLNSRPEKSQRTGTLIRSTCRPMLLLRTLFRRLPRSSRIRNLKKAVSKLKTCQRVTSPTPSQPMSKRHQRRARQDTQMHLHRSLLRPRRRKKKKLLENLLDRAGRMRPRTKESAASALIQTPKLVNLNWSSSRQDSLKKRQSVENWKKSVEEMTARKTNFLSKLRIYRRSLRARDSDTKRRPEM